MLCGESGLGKMIFLNLIVGILVLDFGWIEVDGVDMVVFGEVC